MKNIYLLLVFCLSLFSADAQLLKQKDKVQKKQSDLDWFNCSFDEDGVYGAEVNKAYEFLKDKKLKKRPLVAMITYGMDIEHEDLKHAIWKNRKERNDGKDNDRNGLVDDVNGWNYLGGKDGRVMDWIMREGNREYLRLQKKYGDYIFDGKDYFNIVNGKLTRVDAPENIEEYRYFFEKVLRESTIGSKYGGLNVSYYIKEYAARFDSLMKATYPGKKLTRKEFQICYDPKKTPRDSLSEVAFMMCAMSFSVYKTQDWETAYSGIKDGSQIKMALESYEKELAKSGNDGRKDIVGDNYLDLSDSKYGNNVLLTSDAGIGTMEAGIIAAKRGNGIGMDGIMDEAELMTLRVAAQGEPYLKDIALAIRYAVDHKADVIMIPVQNSLYPLDQMKWISDAIAYAGSKGILVVTCVVEGSQDLAVETYYPNRWMVEGQESANLLVVASSDKDGNPSMTSNYGAKELDLFVPGMQIYSTYTGDTYQRGTGSSLAASAAVGVAALIKAYYPKLTGDQIRKIMLESVTSRKGVEVEKGIRVAGSQSKDLFLFDDLCLSGGILNAYQAVVMADKLAGK